MADPINSTKAGESFQQILVRRGINPGSPEQIEQFARSQGYSDAYTRKVIRGSRKYTNRKGGKDFHFTKGNDAFKVYDSSGKEVTKSGRGKGNQRGFDLGDLVGAGRDVSAFAGLVQDAKNLNDTEDPKIDAQGKPIGTTVASTTRGNEDLGVRYAPRSKNSVLGGPGGRPAPEVNTKSGGGNTGSNTRRGFNGDRTSGPLVSKQGPDVPLRDAFGRIMTPSASGGTKLAEEDLSHLSEDDRRKLANNKAFVEFFTGPAEDSPEYRRVQANKQQIREGFSSAFDAIGGAARSAYDSLTDFFSPDEPWGVHAPHSIERIERLPVPQNKIEAAPKVSIRKSPAKKRNRVNN